ncbi:MAG: LexA regulated protein [Oceanobacter sp.]
MSTQPEDRTTIDMFAPRGRGRPRSNPYDRQSQCRFNKRFQRLRDRQKGLSRLEVKLDSEVIAQLDQACESMELSRAEVVNLALRQWLHL